jgi:hypothetical protein
MTRLPEGNSTKCMRFRGNDFKCAAKKTVMKCLDEFYKG